MLPPVTMWIDPGLMTGIAVYYRYENKFEVDEYPFQRAGEVLWHRMSHFGSSIAVGWERFTIGPETHKLTPQAEAVEIIGVARFLAGVWRCRLLTPAAPGDRDTATMAMLEKLGWWLPGKDDAQSAAQHMLAWMLRANELPPAERQLIGR